MDWINRLEKVSGENCSELASLLEALRIRRERARSGAQLVLAKSKRFNFTARAPLDHQLHMSLFAAHLAQRQHEHFSLCA